MKCKNQKTLDTFAGGDRSEASIPTSKGTMRGSTKISTKRPSFSNNLMKEVLSRDNLLNALKRVTGNKGSPGIDGMTIKELPLFLKSDWPKIMSGLESGTYIPSPVKRVEIPKPNGGVRLLGIPTVLDRFIQQALMQVLQSGYDPVFFNFSYGFRPKRSAQQAVSLAMHYQKQGHKIVIDIDLKKFFDKVSHDKLMGKLARDIKDKSILKLIRSFLRSG